MAQNESSRRRGPIILVLSALLLVVLIVGGYLILGNVNRAWSDLQATRQARQTDIAVIQAELTQMRAMAEATATALFADALVATPLPQPTAQPTPTSIVQVVKDFLGIPTKADGNLARKGETFQTRVKCEKSFNEESSWLICEPGVLLDNTAAWTIPGTKDHWFINVPEGGFTDFSMGEGVISIDGVSLVLPGEQGLNYLVVIRGRIDDGIVDRDLNMTAEISDFVVGHAIWSIMPPGAYVSHDWFRDQLVVSTTTGGTNCGATGCSRVRIVLFDVDSHLYQMFETNAGDIDSWTLLEAN